MGAVYHDGLDAGLALGRAVAQQVLVRATLDGWMKQPPGAIPSIDPQILLW